MKTTHVYFKEGKCFVGLLPENDGCECEACKNEEKQAMFSFLELKEKKDVEKVLDLIYSQIKPTKTGFRNIEPNKLYTVEVEVEVREEEYGHVDDYSKPHGFKSYAFLIEEKKEESQDELWLEARQYMSIVSPNGMPSIAMDSKKLKSQFTITRKQP